MTITYCQDCGKQIHESALACPQCGAPQRAATPPAVQSKGTPYGSYGDVPWWRKNWFAIVCFFFLPPVLVGVLLSGNFYYERSGQLRTYSTFAKIFLILWGLAATARIFRAMAS